MTKMGIAQCISLIKITFPHYYMNFTEKEMEALIKEWNVQFKNDEDKDIYMALQKCISLSTYPPSIASIKEKLYESIDDGKSAEEMWELVREASHNSIYNSYKEWTNLPKDVQKIISEADLRDIALSNTESIRFIKKDFIESYRRYKENKKISFIETSISNNIKTIQMDETENNLLTNQNN